MEISVVVTGVTGYIAGHVAKDLLLKGYTVHGTVRDNTPECVAHLTSFAGATKQLKIFEADLNTPDSFHEAVKGCKYGIHIASPCKMEVKDPQKELIEPALNGTISFLRSCNLANVQKVVITSSIAAVTDEARTEIFTEKDFNTKSSLKRLPYNYSKSLAEKAAFDFVMNEAPSMKLAVINPVLVVGPSLTRRISPSAQTLIDLIAGKYGGILDFYWPFVDVRDVSECHIRAMELESATGRFLAAASPTLHMRDTFHIVSSMGFKVPMRDLTSPWISILLKALSYVFPGGHTGTYIRNYVGLPFNVSNDKVTKELGVVFRDPTTSVRDAYDDLIKWGHISRPKS